MHTNSCAMLTYRRIAITNKDGWNGYLYLHHFGTGWQELVFKTHDDAVKFAAVNKVKYLRN